MSDSKKIDDKLVERIKEVIEPLSTLNNLLDKIKNVQITDNENPFWVSFAVEVVSLGLLFKYAVGLAEKGWILPFEFATDNYLKTEDEIEQILIETNYIEKIQEDTEKKLIYPSNKQQFKDALFCYKHECYAACVYVLSPIIEGYIQNPSNPCSTNILKSFEKQFEDLNRNGLGSPEGLMFVLVHKYLPVYAATIHFTDPEPDLTNRHWIGHGRYRNKIMTRRDCMKLFCIVNAMVNIDEALKYIQQNNT